MLAYVVFGTIANLGMLPSSRGFRSALLGDGSLRFGMVWALFPIGFFPGSLHHLTVVIETLLNRSAVDLADFEMM